MSNEELKRILSDNFPDGKLYLIRVYPDKKDKKNKIVLGRTNRGFNPHELLGLLEHIQLDIIKQIAGEIKPAIVKRMVIEDE